MVQRWLNGARHFMRILVLNTDYSTFLEAHYAAHPWLMEATYDDQMVARNATLFGSADFYSRNLRALGCEAWDVHANNTTMQRTWARENGVSTGEAWENLRDLPKRLVPGRFRRKSLPNWQLRVLADQIEHYRPEVILNHDMYTIPGRFLARFGRRARLIVGQIAAPFTTALDTRGYDLILSSLPNFVRHFRELGLPAELHRLAFDPLVLERVGEQKRDIPVLFVGSLFRTHGARVAILEHLCRRLDIQVWASGAEWLPEDSPIRPRLRGNAWGIDMYHLLARARVSVNHHIDAAGQFANNLRLFEATGMGALLVTDARKNLDELFSVGSEIDAYSDPVDCVARVEAALDDDDRRGAVAGAGQQRTLSCHDYRTRMGELVTILEKAVS